jgi:hypothetical protein
MISSTVASVESCGRYGRWLVIAWNVSATAAILASWDTLPGWSGSPFRPAFVVAANDVQRDRVIAEQRLESATPLPGAHVPILLVGEGPGFVQDLLADADLPMS